MLRSVKESLCKANDSFVVQISPSVYLILILSVAIVEIYNFPGVGLLLLCSLKKTQDCALQALGSIKFTWQVTDRSDMIPCYLTYGPNGLFPLVCAV